MAEVGAEPVGDGLPLGSGVSGGCRVCIPLCREGMCTMGAAPAPLPAPKRGSGRAKRTVTPDRQKCSSQQPQTAKMTLLSNGGGTEVSPCAVLNSGDFCA